MIYGVPMTFSLDSEPKPSLEIEQAVLRGLSVGNYAVIVTDHRKQNEPVAYVNHAFEELTGYKLAEIVGIHPHFLSHDPEQPGAKELETAMRAGQECTTILRGAHKNNTPIWYRVSIIPVLNNQGTVTHFFGSLKDITAAALAVENEESRETFLATLAHDLKSPLQGADRLFALLIDGTLGITGAELQKTLILLSNNNKKALNLVLNLLESYRLNKGSELMHFELQDLGALIGTTVKEVEAGSDTAHLKIQVNVSKDLPNCIFDQLAMSRLLTNLLDNAIKFNSPEGKVRISCGRMHDEIVLRVMDDGKGIAQADSDLIFEKCKRSKNDRYTPGCGLGLYICREIVKAHNGNISFESEVGVSTTFTVRLPARL